MNRRSLLSIIAWPEGATREALAALLAEVTGMEVATARLRLGTQPPLIVGLFDEAHAGHAVARIEKQGGMAFAPTIEAIEALGPTIKIRDMRHHAQRLYLDLWRDDPTNIDPKSIEVIIRGRRSEKKVRPAASASPMFNAAAWRVHAMPAMGMYGAYGFATGLYLWTIEDGAVPPAGQREMRISHMIDLHIVDGRVLQIDADKFGFQVLGEARGHGDLVNTDRLCDMIADLAPGVTVDPYFSLWRPPVEIGRVRIAQVNRNREDPAFALYSRWSALLYRHMNRRMGGPGDGPSAGR